MSLETQTKKLSFVDNESAGFTNNAFAAIHTESPSTLRTKDLIA